MIISTTADFTSSCRWRSVMGLSSEEKEALKSGKPVYFLSDRKAHGLHGTRWRVVKQYENWVSKKRSLKSTTPPGRTLKTTYRARVPDEAVVTELFKVTGEF
jgi:hypothetical protein